MACKICFQSLWIICLLLYVFFVNMLIGEIIGRLKKNRKDGSSDIERGEAIGWLGYFEILSYALSYALGYPQFIAVWIAARMVERWKATKTKTVPGTSPTNVPTGTINIFLLGTLLSVIFGVLGGIFFVKFGKVMFIEEILPIK